MRSDWDGDTVVGILTAVVVVVGVVAAADLLLSFAVIRRLAALQSRMQAGGGSSSPAVGHKIGDFRVNLLAGGEFTLADLMAATAVVVFLTTTCEPCQTAIAELQALPVPLTFTLYVLISGTGEDNDVLAVAANMPTGARVAEISASDPVMQAFGIDGFPTVLRIEDGIVRISEYRVSRLLEHAGK